MGSLRAQRLQRVDWTIIGIILLLGAVGIANLYSAASTGSAGSFLPIYIKQLVFFAVGLCAAFVVVALDYRRWLEYAWILYGLCAVVLIAALAAGKEVSGSSRWISVGPIGFQPSELSKWVIILTLGRYFQQNPAHRGYYSLREILVPILIVSFYAALIVLEPDLGSAVVLLLIGGSILLFAGFRLRSFLWILIIALLALPMVWHGLEDYQRSRVLCFFNPQRDPLGAGYHLTQSKIAVGSGGLLGKGFRLGTQSHLNFLPEHHTDFAFSVWAEEWGFVGALVLLSLFFLLLAYGLYVAWRVEEPAGRLLAFGVVAFFFWPIVINIGMTLGLLPVVGVALPFISYGGTSLLTCLMATALLVNVHMRRFMF